MKADFYITYHHADEMAARWIASELKQGKFSTLSDSWDFLPGEVALEKIDFMFRVSRFVMVLVSGQFLESLGELNKSFSGVQGAVFQKSPLVAEGIVFLVRIDSCEIEKVLGDIGYIDLADIYEKEAVKRLMDAVGVAAPDKKEIDPLPVSAGTRDEILSKRKQEMDQLLAAAIKNNYHMKLDLEQEIKKEVEVKNEKTGEMEKRKEWVWEPVSLETVLKDEKNYILVNPSGMGKTTFLTYAASALLDQEANYPYLPLFFTCIALNNRGGTIEDFIHPHVESIYTHSKGSLVSLDWENMCILIDALDQARDVDDIVSSIQLLDKPLHYKKAKIILSSRQNTADKVKEGFVKIRLKLPEADEVQQYLGEENYQKLAGIIDASGELVKAPVLLEMLKTITEKGHIVSSLYNRAGLYTEFTKVLLDQERSKPRFWQDRLSIHHFIDYELEQALEKIAFFSLADNEILEIPKEKLAQYCESPEKKEALLNIGIILELFEDREQKIVFRHQSFQAYFAARYIYYRQPKLFKQPVSDIAFFYNDVWYEVMRFFMGLEKDPKKAGDIINAIYKTGEKKVGLNLVLRLIFAFYLMSEARVSLEFVKRVHKQLRYLLKNDNQYWAFLKSNTYKFNKPNDEQRRSVFHNVLALLRDKDDDIRNVIVEFLGKIGTSKDIPRLEHMLMDKDKHIRIATIEILGNIGASEHIPLLEPLLRDADFSVQKAAIKAFGKIGTAKDIPFLAPLLRDDNKDMRRKGAKEVRKFGPFLGQLLMESGDKNIRIATIEILGDIGTSEHIPLLEPILRDKDWTVRRTAAGVLEKIGTTKHITLLEPLLSNEDGHIRREAAETLGRIGTSKDIPLLKPLLRDENYFVRYTVARVLGDIGTSKDIPLLELLLKDEHKAVRSDAAEALGKIGTSKDILLLEPLLRDWSADVQRAAAEAFRKIGTSKDIPLLDRMLRDEYAHVRWVAVEVIRKIGNSSHFPLLKPLLRDEEEYVRSAAVYALGEIGTAKDIPLLEPLLRDKKNNVRFAIAVALRKIGTIEHIPLLEPLLRDKDEDVRYKAAEALGNIGDTEHLPLLEPLLRDAVYSVHNTAAEALGKIVTAEDIPLLETMIRDKNRNVRGAVTKALRKIGTSKVIPFLEPLLRDEEEYIRSEAAEALGNIGTSKDIPLLESLLKDKEEYVRRAAVSAFIRIGSLEYIPLLKPLLKDKNENVRCKAAEALENIGTAKDIPLLEPLLCDKVIYVRNRTAKAIEKIYKRSTPKLRIDRVLSSKKEEKVLPIKLFSSQSLHILHISDIHYALEKDPTITCIFHEFLKDIKKWRSQQNHTNIQAICLTGDIAASGENEQYEAIQEKINAILETTGCTKENLFIIPGNHDVQEYDQISDQGKTLLEQVHKKQRNIDSDVLSNFENYHKFHNKFSNYFQFIETSGYLNSLPEYHNQTPKPWYNRKLKDFPVRIMGLNSALFCLKDFCDYGKIRMGIDQFHEAFFEGKVSGKPENELVILLTHHPINWLAENEYDDYTTLMERYSVIHLHGHIHKTHIEKKQRLFSSSVGYISIGTGSLYGEKGKEDINTYHIITLDFENQEVVVWARRWNPDLGKWTVYDDDVNNRFPLPTNYTNYHKL